MIEIRPARFADARALAPALRYQDAREIASGWGSGAFEGLLACLLCSDRAFAVTEHGRVTALWGVSDGRFAGLRLGTPWLLAGEALFRHRRWLVQRGRAWLLDLLLDYDLLANITDEDNAAHRRWLRWSGFVELRRIAPWGLAGRVGREFYMVNPRRGLDGQRVRELLLDRAPPARRPIDGALGHLVTFAVAALGAPTAREGRAASHHALPGLFAALEGADGSRYRSAALRLLAELAAGHRSVAPPAGAAPLTAEWFGALADLADTLQLDPGLDLPEAVAAITPPQAVNPPPARSPAGPPAAPPVALRQLVRQREGLLTFGGRVGAAHGYRLRAAASAMQGEGSWQGSVALRGLERAVAEAHLRRVIGAAPQAVGDASIRDWMNEPLDHGAALSRLAGAVTGNAIGDAVRCLVDRWPVDAASRSLPAVACRSHAMTVAELLARRSAEKLLPALRLGGVASGLVEQYALAGLLMARLRCAVAQRAPGYVERLLLDEITALLIARRLDDRLLAGADRDQAEAGVMHDAMALWGSGPALQPDLLAARLLRIVLDPLQELRLMPAVLAYQLLRRRALAAAVARLGEVLGADGTESRRGFRKFLRRHRARLLIVDLHEDGAGDEPQRDAWDPDLRSLGPGRTDGVGQRAGAPGPRCRPSGGSATAGAGAQRAAAHGAGRAAGAAPASAQPAASAAGR